MTIVRFAPSPTGRIHLGNARPALLNWYFAKANGGQYVLRFDDTDTARSTREFADGIQTDLAWLGITPDTIYRQSERFDLYDAARDKLIAAGRLYPCYETPDELDRRRARARAMGRPPVYDRAALELTAEDKAKFEAEGRTPHWRFKLDTKAIKFDDQIRGEQTINTSSMSDPVLIRGDGTYLYTLPSVVDDIEMGITHIIRGEDHVSNSAVQIDIFEALGEAAPAFAHHNLLTDEQGKGLSKRLGSLSLCDLREQGYEAMTIATMASITGTSLPVEPYASLQQVAEQLTFSTISHGPARFAPTEMDALNARIIHAMTYETAQPRLAELGLDRPELWHALRENLAKFGDIVEWSKLIDGPITPVIESDDREFISQAADLLPQEPWDETTWGAWTKAVKEASGRKGKQLFHPLRHALTGRGDGPELKTLLPLLGRTACLDRLS